MLKYRPAEAKDWPFISETFLDSYKHCHAAGIIQMLDWYEVMRPQLQKILSRPGCATWVAYNPSETEPGTDLYGWAAVERDYKIPTRSRVDGQWVTSLEPCHDPLVHYVFTKQAYRKLGIARGLLRAAGVNPSEPFNYSCKTPVLDKLRSRIPMSRWQPLLCRFPKETESK